MKKALVLYSGGLDSKLVVQILKEQDFQITALHFALPFGCSCLSKACISDFKKDKIKLEILDVKKEPLLSEYLEIIENPKFGRGSGANPCKDCKIFMFKKAYEYANKNKIDVIVTGEVLGQRPMSQIPRAMKTIDDELNFEILRPLSALNLEETKYEKSGIVDRNKLFAISGRERKEQIALAKKYNIKFPTPGGGCFLCEKIPSKKFHHLLKNKLIDEKTLKLVTIGRHFKINDCWFVVARNKKESLIISSFKNSIQGSVGKPSIYFNKESGKQKALELRDAYSTGDNENKRNKFSKFKI